MSRGCQDVHAREKPEQVVRVVRGVAGRKLSRAKACAQLGGWIGGLQHGWTKGLRKSQKREVKRCGHGELCITMEGAVKESMFDDR